WSSCPASPLILHSFPTRRSSDLPAREVVRVAPPVARVLQVPDGFVAGPPPEPLTARFRRRETGVYGEAPYVEEWKPLPPRLHDLDRKSTRLNSSHEWVSYAVFFL